MSQDSTGLSDIEKPRDSTPKSNLLVGWHNDADLVRIFGKTQRTIARWRAKRWLPYTMVGKTPMSSDNHIQQMLRANEVGLIRRRRG
jgi:hypothetical protein